MRGEESMEARVEVTVAMVAEGMGSRKGHCRGRGWSRVVRRMLLWYVFILKPTGRGVECTDGMHEKGEAETEFGASK